MSQVAVKWFCNHCTTIFCTTSDDLVCPKCNQTIDPKYRFARFAREDIVREDVLIPEGVNDAEVAVDTVDTVDIE